MTFEEWFELYVNKSNYHTKEQLKRLARHSWEAALTCDPAKSHATPVAFAQVLENGDLRIRAAGLHMLSDILDGSSAEQPLYLQPDRQEWQPIEAAPNRTDVLAVFYGATVARAHRDGNSWWTSTLGEVLEAEEAPTHWMPLPKPPKGSEV